MSYKINKTDGTLLVDLIDGRFDSDTTDLTLIGRNLKGYGEILNENFIKILENFANVAAPSNPIKGQLWYDTSEGRLKVYDGIIFKSTDSTVVSNIQPALVQGDLWINSGTNQLYFFDGTNPILVGPAYTGIQGTSGLIIETITDTSGVGRVVAKLLISNTPVAIISPVSFTAANVIVNFGTNIQSGINISTQYQNDFIFRGKAQSTSTLLDSLNNPFTPNDFLKISSNNTAIGSLHVKNDNGIIVGDDSDFVIKVESNNVVLRSQISNANVKYQIRQGFSNVEYLTVDNINSRIGIWQSSPQYDFDVNGDVRISGNLTVSGNTTYLDVANLRVEDKLIELAIPSDSTLLPDIDVDGAGISIRASGTEKNLTWNYTHNTWDSNVNFNIAPGFAYKIGYSNILSSTSLGASVTSAVGLTEIGTLSYLNIDNININNATITANIPLVISSAGDIQISSPVKMYGIASPDISDTDDYVATKGYVDNSWLDRDIWLSLDITGLTNNQIALVIEDLVPGSTKNSGVYCLVHCVTYTGSFTYDGDDGISKNFVAVDKNGTENQSVLQDISFSSQTSSVSLSITRSRKRFIVNGSNVWTFDADLTSSV